MTNIAHRIPNQSLSPSLESLVPSGQQEVMRLYDAALVESSRLLYPVSGQAAYETEQLLIDSLTAAHLSGNHVVIVDGAFDVPHDNHTWYLREARLRAAQKHFGKLFVDASNASKQEMVASDEIILLVTLDADDKIAAKKGFIESKGNTVRPVYTWEARANRIGGFMIPNGKGAWRPVLDIVTVEGDSAHAGTMFESHLQFGKRLADLHLLDTWVLFDEHGETLEAALETTSGEEKPILSIVDQNAARYSIDKRTGKWWSSSAIINSIKSATNVSISKEPSQLSSTA